MSAATPLRCIVVAALLTLCEAGGSHAPAPAPAAKTHHIGWYIPGAHSHGNVTETHANANIGAGKVMKVKVKDTVHFMWKDSPGTAMHQLDQMLDEAHLTSCNFTGSTVLVAAMKTGAYTLPTAAAGTHYFSCNVSGHCAAGQKIIITIEAHAATSGSVHTSSFGFIVCAIAVLAQLFN